MRTTFTRLLPLLGIALLLTGCPPATSDSSFNGKILHCDLAADPERLDPATMTGVPEGRIVFNVFEGLFMPSQDGAPVAGSGINAPVVYGAAESHEVSDDQLTWTFHLRKNGKWHNGDPVLASDFVYAWKRVLTLNADYAEMFDRVKNAAAFRDPKDTSVTDFAEVTLENPCQYFAEILAFYTWFPVNEKVVEKFGDDWTRVENYCGNGPFRLKEFAQRQRVLLEKFADWHDAASVKLDRVELLIIPDDAARNNQYTLGQLDMVLGGIPNEKMRTWKGTPDFHIDPYFGTYYYRFNVTDPTLKDKRVRQALGLAIDREALCNTVLQKIYAPATGFVPPIKGYTSANAMKTDINRARELLAEAGYNETNRLPSLTLLYNSEAENHRLIANEIQQQWTRQLGITVELEHTEWKNVLDRYDNLNYQVGRAGWIGDWTEPDTFLDIFQGDAGNNDTGWVNDEYDRLLNAARSEGDRDKRMKLFEAAEKILLEECAITPIYFYANPRLTSTRVQNFKPHPRGVTLFRYLDITAE